MVFYRTYRPQKIDELDNENVRLSLYSIFARTDYPHAFLLTGPKGLGKTSSARIIAKVITCEKHKNLKGKLSEKEIEPDNKCQQCQGIISGNNLDVIEIDGASNRGIDEIRDLRDKIKLAPFKALKKVYIIDEVHMLTTEAFNALLKTLEEPPSHAVFILCTTEPQKLPETISSRCFRLNFSRASEEELVRSLSRIVKGEGIKIEKEALFQIAKLSDGSFRDGAKILEEVSTFSGRKTITADLVNEKYNTLGIGESVSQMIEAISSKNAKKALVVCRELAKQGMDFKFFIENLIDKLHHMLLVEAGVEEGKNTSNLSFSDIQKLFELLSDAHQATKYSVLPQIPLEIAILDWVGEEGVVAEVADENFVNPPKSIGKQHSGLFEDLINEIKTQNNLFAGVLRSCKAQELKNGKLTIFASSKFHKEKIEEAKNMKLLQDSLQKITGGKINVLVTLNPPASKARALRAGEVKVNE